jgi:uncharacterized protein (TIGR03083 family)
MLPLANVQAGYPAELLAAASLLRSLTADDLARASRCEGWTVGDVAGHLVGGIVDALNGRLDDAGSAAWTARQVEERRGRSAAELGDELEGASKAAADLLASFDEAVWAGPGPAAVAVMGAGVISMWFDAVMHAEDIRSALGSSRPLSQSDALACVDHIVDSLAGRGWGPATVALDGLPELTIGNGSGIRVTGDPLTFALVATGRADPATLGLGPDVNLYA